MINQPFASHGHHGHGGHHHHHHHHQGFPAAHHASYGVPAGQHVGSYAPPPAQPYGWVQPHPATTWHHHHHQPTGPYVVAVQPPPAGPQPGAVPCSPAPAASHGPPSGGNQSRGFVSSLLNAVWGTAGQARQAIDPVPQTPRRPTEATVNSAEVVCLATGWALTVTLWFFLLFIIPMCEAKRSAGENYSTCSSFYGSFNDEGVFSHTTGFKVMMSFVVFGYLLHAWLSPVRKHVFSRTPDGSYMEHVVEGAPSFEWSITAYHEVKKWDEDQHGHRSNERTERHATNWAKGRYAPVGWNDLSYAIPESQSAPIRRIRCTKHFVFADDDAETDYINARGRFITSNATDVSYDAKEEFVIEGYRSHALAFSEDDPPFGFSVVFYLISVLLGCAMPYHMYFLLRTAPVDFRCIKEL